MLYIQTIFKDGSSYVVLMFLCYITHGMNPRQNIWTFIAYQDENQTTWEDCPCSNLSLATTPQYVGNNYYCGVL